MSDTPDRLAAYDFHLPEAHIALRPVSPQDAARLLVVYSDGRLEDRHIYDLTDLLSPGDTLVFNDTRVLPAALKGVRTARDASGQDVAIDVNLIADVSEDSWRVLARPGKRLKLGDTLDFGAGFHAQIEDKYTGGDMRIRFNRSGGALLAAIEAHGAMPLPPYIARRRAADAQDRQTYQTGYARGEAKSVAAPTAGLHFTPRLMAKLSQAGIFEEYVRLHVGLGTFAPLQAAQIEAGRLHAEWRNVSDMVAKRLNARRANSQRCIAVGTTALRTLESAVTEGEIVPVSGATDIFIQPGYRFQAIDGLLTNFHLPRSSLFMLVCALMGTDIMQAAYAHAIARNYRFYSYGDACLLLL